MAKTVEAAAIISAKDLTGPAFASASRHARGFQRNTATITRQMKAQTATVIGFGKAIGAALGITAAAAAYKLGRAFKDTAESLDQLDELSKQVGMKAGHIQILTQIAKKEGISGEQVQQSIKNVSQAYVTLQRNLRGSKQLTAAFPGLSQQIKNAQSVEEAVSIALTAIDKMSPEAALKWSKMMFGNEDFSKLRKNMQTWRAEIREAKRLGGWITPEMTKAAADYNDSMDDLGTAIQSVITPMTADLAKAMTPHVKNMTEWVVANRELIRSKFDEFFGRVAEFAKTTAKEIDLIVRGVNALIEGVKIAQRLLNTPISDLLGAPTNQGPAGAGRGRSVPQFPRRGSEGGYGSPPTRAPQGHGRAPRQGSSGLPYTGPVDQSGFPTGKPGTKYRPAYKLSEADLSNAVVNTIAGEARMKDPRGVDAVINNMLNRVGSKAYGPSGNLHQVARAPGQYAGYRRANEKEAAIIRARIKAIASGDVPDITGGSNEFRAAWYGGPWMRKRGRRGRNIGGNVFARNPDPGASGPFSPYPEPKSLQSNMSTIQSARQQQQTSQVHQIGKGQVDLNIRVGGQPVKVERIRVQQPDLMTLNTGVDNTGARHYRPGAPMLGPI